MVNTSVGYATNDEHMDPRVQVELENLNTSTEFINKLEFELEKARSEFNKLLIESTNKIELLSKKLGSSIHKARPYYEARISANDLHLKAQNEAVKYKEATVEHNKAKEIIHLAEQGLHDNSDSQSNLDEILTNSAEKVNSYELERLTAEKQHEITSRAYCLTEQRLSKLHQHLKRSIVKASLEARRNFLELNNYASQHQLQLLPYFEMKSQFNQMLDEQMNKIHSYEDRVNKAKLNYTKALQRLEELNSQIYVDSPELNSNEDYLQIATTKSNNCEIDPGTVGQNESHCSDNIFDNKLLDKLILDDNLENMLDNLQKECLNEK